MDGLIERAIAAVAPHPAVTSAALAGSRARGTHAGRSDWDVAVQTTDFPALARDLPALVAPLHPLAGQWEPLGHFPVFMVMLRGPAKLEYPFLEESQEPAPPLTPGPQTLVAIDAHFWDWIWWLATKASIGRTDLVAEHLPQLQRRILQPLGVPAMPSGIDAAIAAFTARRDALEGDYGLRVPRALEDEVRRGIAQIGTTPRRA